DNDCDGQVDNVAGRGEACSAGLGACERDGVLRCDGVSGDLVCTAQPLEPQPELCNAIDDDCDGVIDNVQGAGEPCEAGEGDCRSEGERVCDPVRVQLVCNARLQAPQPEVCDHRDNDCDGQVDEGGVCPEICDGIDNNGNGQVDEGCDEVCDGVDNNENGQVDEGELCGAGQICQGGRCIPAPACQPDGSQRACGDNSEGACQQGTQTCQDGQWGVCVGRVDPVAEQCDGVDNDCDGRIDNGALCPNGRCTNGRCENRICQPGATEACAGQSTGECEPGTRTCAADGFSWGACVGVVGPANETCNGRDDDCDGQVDDGNLCGAGQECVAGGCRCQDRAEQRCSGGDVYWYDSCGNRGARAEDCGANEICVENGDQASCVCEPNVDQRCSGGDVYWYDACGNRGVRADDCNADEICENARCVPACQADDYWSPNAGIRSVTVNGTTLTVELRGRPDNIGIDLQVCKQGGEFGNDPIHIYFEEWAKYNGRGMLETSRVASGRACTDWIEIASTANWVEGDRLGGQVRIISPARCEANWEQDGGRWCNNPPEPGCGSCWHFGSTALLTRTCRN
ncbi:MAG: hypothetical protein KC613_06005, partial [Myxococcales bacterium]|nr:hypothetical protein [Myxococcales bacterium]